MQVNNKKHLTMKPEGPLNVTFSCINKTKLTYTQLDSRKQVIAF